MAVSKETMLDAFGRFKQLQDAANEDKFVAQEAGKSLMTDAERTKLAGIDPTSYVTKTQMQTLLATWQEVLGGTYIPPDTGGDNTGGNTGDNTGGDNTDPPAHYDPEEDGDEEITDDDLKELFGDLFKN